MASPPAHKPARGPGAFFGNLFKLRKNNSWSELKEGSSRRGRRTDDDSVGRDSSTRSIMFDLELSQRGHRSSAAPAERLSKVQLEESAKTVTRSSLATSRIDAVLQRATYLSRPMAAFEVDLLQDVQALRGAAEEPHGTLDLVRLATDLISIGYSCALQRNDPTDPGQRTAAMADMDHSCLEKLRHEFIVCTGRADGSVHHYCLVDPRFMDQFALGQPTTGYGSILAALPVEFVGSPLRLQALANLLCVEIAAVYREQGLPLPPWRKPTAILSRWFDVDTPALPQRSPAPQQQQRKAIIAAQDVTGEPSTRNANERKYVQGHESSSHVKDIPGGSTHFYSMLALHQDSLLIQRQRRQQDHSDTASEKSNKPRRQAKMMQLEQRQALEGDAEHLGSPGNHVLPSMPVALGKSRSGVRSDLATIAETRNPDGRRDAGRSIAFENLNEFRRDVGSSQSTPHLPISDMSASGNSPSQTLLHQDSSKAVSLLAKSLRTVGQRDTWSNIIPGMRSSNRNFKTGQGSSGRNTQGSQ